ncbi:MAG: hypothetical protein AAGA54_09860 [Myxococcota bacterium]
MKTRLLSTLALLSITAACDDAPEAGIHSPADPDCPYADTAHRTACLAGATKFEDGWREVCDDLTLSPRRNDNNGVPIEGFKEYERADAVARYHAVYEHAFSDAAYILPPPTQGIPTASSGYWGSVKREDFLEAFHLASFGVQPDIYSNLNFITDGTPWGDFSFDNATQFYNAIGLGPNSNTNMPEPIGLADNYECNVEKLRRGDIVIGIEGGSDSSAAINQYLGALGLAAGPWGEAIHALTNAPGIALLPPDPTEQTTAIYGIVAPAEQTEDTDFPSANSTAGHQSYWAFRWELEPNDNGDWTDNGRFASTWSLPAFFPVSLSRLELRYLPGQENCEDAPVPGYEGGVYFPLRADFNKHLEQSTLCDGDLLDGGLLPCSSVWVNDIEDSDTRNEFSAACSMLCYDTAQYANCESRLECLGFSFLGDDPETEDLAQRYCPQMDKMYGDGTYGPTPDAETSNDENRLHATDTEYVAPNESYELFNVVLRRRVLETGWFPGWGGDELSRLEWCAEADTPSSSNKCYFDSTARAARAAESANAAMNDDEYIVGPKSPE